MYQNQQPMCAIDQINMMNGGGYQQQTEMTYIGNENSFNSIQPGGCALDQINMMNGGNYQQPVPMTYIGNENSYNSVQPGGCALDQINAMNGGSYQQPSNNPTVVVVQPNTFNTPAAPPPPAGNVQRTEYRNPVKPTTYSKTETTTEEQCCLCVCLTYIALIICGMFECLGTCIAALCTCFFECAQGLCSCIEECFNEICGGC